MRWFTEITNRTHVHTGAAVPDPYWVDEDEGDDEDEDDEEEVEE